ncbi:hypothetical protein BUALT_Bualt16G0020800 [Buddleja alternifolia]|uniref:U1-type domain-containing protein n=1 Tax=Buddleja alternifolia TaxID=168488 RepID=A0AAV6W8J6_9LAMI|nr:hypothetical protein BUALT_Bualt16G0020800 [Buddleja alternifolia]
MDHTKWAEMQQNPNPIPNPNSVQFQAPIYNPNYPNYYPQNFNSDPYKPVHYAGVDPNNALIPPQPLPPGVDPPYVPPPAVAYTQQPISFEAQQSVDAVTASYYQDPNASWAAAISQYGAAPYAAGVTVHNPPIQTQRSGIRRKAPTKRAPIKKVPKKPKIVQSVWCEVCKLACNTQEVLDQHKLGKKHKKNLDKLIKAATPAPVATPAPIDKPIIGPEPNPEKRKKSKAQKTRKKSATVSTEDLETKRRKIMEEGATSDGVRACAVCNVVCNSETVFNYHLAGQKHAAMVKKHNAMAGVAPPAI